MKALVIGFEGYQGRVSNPAAAVAHALNGKTVGKAAVTGASIPVAYSGLRERLWKLIDAHEPSLVLGLGLWPGEPVIRIEQLAYNCADFEMPDEEAYLARGERLAPEGPKALEATVPTERIVGELLISGIPARCSQTAGTFLCNAMFYLLLEAAESKYAGMKCGFVHLPYLPSQVAELLRTIDEERRLGIYQRADLASMDENKAVEALMTVINVAAGE